MDNEASGSGGFGHTIRNSILILLFEFLGTLLLALLFNASVYEPTENGQGFLLGTWVLIIFSAKVSGSHFNPAITLAFMMRKDIGKRFSRPIGLAYMVFQFGGAICGVLVNYMFVHAPGKLGVKDNSFIS